MATVYGSDTTCLTDIPLIDQQVTDPRILVGQRTARRLTTPRGALAAINDDPAFGWDVRQYINAKLTPAQIAGAQAQIESEVLKDEQIQSVNATLTFSEGSLSISLQLQGSAGPFTLTLNVEQLTTQLIFNFGSP
jgi:hypothetical protein